MPRRPCISCKRLIPKGSLCDDCRAERDAGRVIAEPWRRLYSTGEWRDAQRRCLQRDGGQCRAAVSAGQRCPATERLQAHHRTALRDSWREYGGDWDAFVSVATVVDELVSLCPRHHAMAERSLRGAIPGR